MLLFYRYQVLSDGCLIDNDNGRIITPLTKRKKKEVAPHHLVRDDNGKTHFFSVKFLLEKLGVENDTPHLGQITEEDLLDDYNPIQILEKKGRTLSDTILEDVLGDI